MKTFLKAKAKKKVMHKLPNILLRRAAALVALFAAMLLAACTTVTPYSDPVVVEVPLEGLDDLGAADEDIIEPSDTYIYEDDASGLSEKELLEKRVIYFDYDSSFLSELGEAVSNAHARNLGGDANARVILEGHADERGTREYNLALAEDRAKTVADVLQALGVDGARIEVVSYGEERPAAAGSNEAAWSQNRRVEILYQ
ncbi:MAG: OmpA family protein [Gammaproteobacteria bacterium]|nr:OmpA family protein [Gammaproteobacteria bacterium]MDA8014500.1 OmpA family protein [Gammaproteobacteria bacterium]